MADLPTKSLLCGEYLPDQPDLNNPGISVAQNVIPRTKTSYSPMPSFQVSASTALNSAPLGAFSAVDSVGNVGNYVGTASKLYSMTNATKPNFVDVSNGTYAVPGGSCWNFSEADGYVYATNGSDKIQRHQTGTTGNFANHPDTNAPTARYITFIQPGFLLLGDINDPTVGIQPQGVRWSALGDATSFPLVGGADAIAANSDWQKCAGDIGRMRGFATNLATCNCAVFFERAVFRMIFTGTQEIFSILPIENERGTPSARALAQVGQVVYYLGWDGFYAFDGTESVPIGDQRVNRTFFQDCDPNYLQNVTATVDPTTGIVFWEYAGTGNVNGVPNRLLVFNPTMGRFALTSGQTGNNLFIARTLGTSLEGIDALGYNLDNLPFSLDSVFLAGGNITLGGFSTDFKYGAFTGPNMAFTVDTSEGQLIGARKARIQAVRPLVEGDVCSAAVGGRNLLSTTAVFDSVVAPDENGMCPARNESRYHRIRLVGAAGNLCTHISGAEVTYSAGGGR